MTQPLPEPVFLVLAEEEAGGRIVVDLEAFVRFNILMDESLTELEAKWSHLGPPRAARRPVPPRMNDATQ